MKKLSALIAIILILAFTIPPLLVGIFFQKHYDEELKLLAQNLKLQYRILEYKRGWFHSNAKIAVNFPLVDKTLIPGSANDQNALIFKQKITHGLFVFDQGKKYLPFSVAIAKINSYFDDAHIFAQTTLTLDSSIQTYFSLNNYAIKQGNKIIYSLSGLKGQYVINENKSHVVTNLTLKHLFANVDMPREVTNFSTHEELNKAKSDVWIGKKYYHFGALKWQQANKTYFFENFDYAVDSQLIAELFRTKLNATIQSARVDNHNYGPQQVTLSFNGLNSDALKSFQQAVELGNENSVQSNAQNNLLRLLNQGADLRVEKLSLNTAWGQINLKAAFSCPCNNHADNFSALIPTLDTNINGEIPTALANSLLSDYFLISSGYLDREFAKAKAKTTLTNFQRAGWLRLSGEYFLINVFEPANNLPYKKAVDKR